MIDDRCRTVPRSGRIGTTEEETADAISDHNDIRDTIAAAANYEAGSNGRYGVVAAANVANGDHMAEEEREGLTDFRRKQSLRCVTTWAWPSRPLRRDISRAS